MSTAIDLTFVSKPAMLTLTMENAPGEPLEESFRRINGARADASGVTERGALATFKRTKFWRAHIRGGFCRFEAKLQPGDDDAQTEMFTRRRWHVHAHLLVDVRWVDPHMIRLHWQKHLAKARHRIAPTTATAARVRLTQTALKMYGFLRRAGCPQSYCFEQCAKLQDPALPHLLRGVWSLEGNANIKRIKNTVYECAKYVTKLSDVEQASDADLDELCSFLSGRRTQTAFGHCHGMMARLEDPGARSAGFIGSGATEGAADALNGGEPLGPAFEPPPVDVETWGTVAQLPKGVAGYDAITGEAVAVADAAVSIRTEDVMLARWALRRYWHSGAGDGDGARRAQEKRARAFTRYQRNKLTPSEVREVVLSTAPTVFDHAQDRERLAPAAVADRDPSNPRRFIARHFETRPGTYDNGRPLPISAQMADVGHGNRTVAP